METDRFGLGFTPLWDGSEDDLLIRKVERTTLEPSLSKPVETPEIKKLIEAWSKAKSVQEKAAIHEQIQMAGAMQEFKTLKPMIHTQIHENIVVNQNFTNEDFVYPIPAGVKPFEK